MGIPVFVRATVTKRKRAKRKWNFEVVEFNICIANVRTEAYNMDASENENR
jgi:hypothetical protein